MKVQQCPVEVSHSVYSWHTSSSSDLEKAKGIVESLRTGRQTALEWDTLQWLTDGFHVRWKTAVQHRAARHWFVGTGLTTKRFAALSEKWLLVGHGNAFDAGQVAQARASAEVASGTAASAPAASALAPSGRTPQGGEALADERASCSWNSPTLKLLVSGTKALQNSWKYYEKGDRIGEGSFGVVYSAWCLRGGERQECAMKKAKEVEDRDLIAAEAFALERCVGHPSIVQLLDVVMCPQRAVYVVTEFVGMDLHRRLHTRRPEYSDDGPGGPVVVGPRLSQEQVRLTARQVLLALSHLADLHIGHGDVKPSNILTKDRAFGQVRSRVVFDAKLADFGNVFPVLGGGGGDTEYFVAETNKG